jgi:hypothetical protein
VVDSPELDRNEAVTNAIPGFPGAGENQLAGQLDLSICSWCGSACVRSAVPATNVNALLVLTAQASGGTLGGAGTRLPADRLYRLNEESKTKVEQVIF